MKRIILLVLVLAALLMGGWSCADDASAQYAGDGTGGECPHTGWVYGGGYKWYCNDRYQVIEGPYIA